MAETKREREAAAILRGLTKNLRGLTKNLREHMAMAGKRHFECVGCTELVERAEEWLRRAAAQEEARG